MGSQNFLLRIASTVVATTLPALATDVVSDTAVFGFPDFLDYANATSRGWNFGNSVANAPTVTLRGVTMTGNQGVADAVNGLSFTTAPLTYAISGFVWGGATEQAAKDALSRGGLHGGSGNFAMKITATPGQSYLVDILSLDAFSPAGRSMDVRVDGQLVQDDWFVPVGNPYNRVLRLRVVADGDGLDLTIDRGGIAGTDQNPAISALAVTQELDSEPIIGTAPRGQTQPLGGRAVFRVIAAGSPAPTFQWRKNGADLPGETAAELVLDPVTADDAAEYDVVLTNTLGTVTTTAVPLDVVTPLAAGAGILQDLVGYWRFDETQGGTAADTSGQHNSGTLVNFAANSEAQWTTGRVGGALRFEGPGANHYVIVDNFPKTPVAYTISAWVMADTIPVWASIAKNWFGQFHFGLDASNNGLSNYLGTTTGQPSAKEQGIFPTGSWQHVVATADGATLRLFRNGVEVASAPYSGAFFSPAPDRMGIGAKLNGAAADTGAPGYWDGLIDDLALWTRALSATEVQSLFSAGAAGNDITHAVPDPQSDALVINEILADNVGGLEDEDRDSPDWIELYNGTATAVNLDGWYLSDNDANLTKWRFPAQTLEPGAYLVVFASGKDRRVAGQALHTNFQIATRNEPVVLTRPDGVTVAHRLGLWRRHEPNVSLGLSAGGTVTSFFAVPTPGQPNVAPLSAAGAVFTERSIDAPPLAAGEPLVVSTVVDPVEHGEPTDPVPPTVTGVTVAWRVMFGAETTVAMNDSGTDGDETAGDGRWSATIPATATAGQMLRWRFTATTSRGDVTRSPANFTDRSPKYFGTVVADPSINTPLQVVHRFVETPSLADTVGGTRCSILVNGEFFDNVGIRIRGNTSRGFPKKSHKIDGNPGWSFKFDPDAPRVSELNLNTTYTDKSYVRAMLTTRIHQLSGMRSPDIVPVHQRQNGQFYSVALAVENLDDTFLERHGMDEHGSLYKGVGDVGATDFTSATTFEKKNRFDEGYADLQAVVSAMNLPAAARETWLWDNIDMASLVNWWAGVVVTQNIDASNKNFFFYRDTNGSGEWQMLPWDLDLTFGPDALNTDTIVYNRSNVSTPACASAPYIGARPFQLHANKYNRLLEALAASPRFRAMFTRRIRTLTDRFLGDPAWLPDRMGEYQALLGADVVADRAKWGGSSHFNWSGGGVVSLQVAMNRILNEYATPRLGYLLTTHGGAETLNWTTGAGSAGVPAAQGAEAVLTIAEAVHDASGAAEDEDYLRLVNPGTTAVDVSGWELEGGVRFTFKGGTVVPAGGVLHVAADRAAFRARTTGPRGGQDLHVVGDWSGRFTNFGETVRLVRAGDGAVVSSFTLPADPTPVQRWLRLTEVNYNPPSATDLEEFVEMTNTSAAATLDLAGVVVAEGLTGTDPSTGAPVRFVFPAGTTLAPGQSVLLVRDAAAFAAAFPSVPVAKIAGTFPAGTALDNAGEVLRLEDAAGVLVDEVSWEPGSATAGKSVHVVPDPAALQPPRDAFAFAPNPGQWLVDTDGDGLSDLGEIRAGTDAGDASSFLQLTVSVDAAGKVTGSFPVVAGRRYRVTTSDGLSGWTALGADVVPAADGVHTFEHTPGGGTHFYRVELP